MWDLLLAFHAYIRQAEIYGEESINFLNGKQKKMLRYNAILNHKMWDSFFQDGVK